MPVTTLLYCDVQAAFLTGEEFLRIKVAAMEYLAAEQDLRGYVPGKGWAHSVAHTADLLAWLARSPHANDDDLADMLDAISRKLLAFLAALHLMVTYQPDLAEATRAAMLQAIHGAARSYVSFIA